MDILISLAALGAAIVAWSKVGALKLHVRNLEQRITDVEDGRQPVRAASPAPAPAWGGMNKEAEVSAPETPSKAEVPEPAPVAAKTDGKTDAVMTTGAGEPEARETPTSKATQNRPLVFSEERFNALVKWLVGHWVYVISAVSLGLAGLFLVQYGMENGLLPPELRVLSALALGLGLTVAGEHLRRRYGTRPEGAGQLPTTFSAAGLVAMFGAVISARALYGLIGPELAFAGLVAVSGYAVVLGWVNGAFLTAFGLVGASLAPFLAGGDSANPVWLNYYFVLIAGVGLVVDTLRRWAWISVLALVIGYGGVALTLSFTTGTFPAVAALLVLLVLALCVPVRRFGLAHEGPGFVAFALNGMKGAWPSFPVRLAAGAMVATSAGLWMLGSGDTLESLLIFTVLAVLAMEFLIAGRRAPGIADLALLPLAAWFLRLVTHAMSYGPVAVTALPIPVISLLLAQAALLALVAAWRAVGERHFRLLAAGVALIVPVATLILHLFWRAEAVLGAEVWGGHVMAMAALMTALAVWFGRLAPGDLRAAASATLSALALIALAVFVLLTGNALTLALGVLVVAAAALDRRFGMAEMGWFIQAAVLVLGWRLVADPGIDWAFTADLGELWFVFGGALALMGAALAVVPQSRQAARVFLESGTAGGIAIFAEVLVFRWLDGVRLQSDFAEAAVAGFAPMIFMLAQLYRLKLGGTWLFWTRAVLAALGAIVALAVQLATLTIISPLAGGGKVVGPLLIDTLALTYLVPGAVLLAAAFWMGHLRRPLRIVLQAWGGVMVTAYVVCEIRRFWQGDDLSVMGVTQGELYSYTVAMMVTGGVLLWQAIARRSRVLRLVAMAVIVATVAKVFLFDASGLTGLTRVASFLGLGLALAAVAWLNHWAAQGEEGLEEPETPQT